MLATPVTVHVALASGRVDGAAILGRGLAAVEGVLGGPRRVERFPVRRDLVFAGIEVIFGNGRTASAILVSAPSVALPPPAMRAELAAAGLRESRRYRCDAKGCFGTFFTGSRRVRVIYGLERGSPYLGFQLWPQP